MKLEDVCKVFTDGDWIESKDQSDNGIRLIQTGNIGEGVYLEKSERAKYVSQDTFDALKCTEIYSGDVLVSRLPEPVGRACIIPPKSERMITAVDCTICRPNEEIVLKEYLCYFMQSDVYYNRLLNNVTGTTRKRISRKNLGNEDEHCFLNPFAEGKVAGNDCCGLGNVLGRNGAFARLALYLWAAFGMGVLLWTLCCFVSCPQAQCLPLPKYPLH